MSAIDELIDSINANRGRYYIYMLSKPDGTPFYIGKGIGRRMFQHEADARGQALSHKLNTIRQILRSGSQIRYDILCFYDDERECHAREVAEVMRIGRHDLGTGPLTNLTSGGEGTSGLSEETKARIDAELHGHDAPGERGIANRFFLQLCGEVRSVPVRPFLATRTEVIVPLVVCRTPTLRMAAALAAGAIVGRVLIQVGAEIPRRFDLDGVPMVLENGVCRDVLRAGMAVLSKNGSQRNEILALTELGAAEIVRLVNRPMLIDAGVLMPAE